MDNLQKQLKEKFEKEWDIFQEQVILPVESDLKPITKARLKLFCWGFCLVGSNFSINKVVEELNKGPIKP